MNEFAVRTGGEKLACRQDDELPEGRRGGRMKMVMMKIMKSVLSSVLPTRAASPVVLREEMTLCLSRSTAVSPAEERRRGGGGEVMRSGHSILPWSPLQQVTESGPGYRASRKNTAALTHQGKRELCSPDNVQ